MDLEGRALLEDCSLEISSTNQMVVIWLSLLIVDGSLNVYDYRGNYNALFRWLKETTPKNIDRLTPVNEWELCDPGTQNSVDVTNGGDLLLEQFQYHQRSQGLNTSLLF